MVKTPRTHHSKQTREPVTIDLSPEEVSRVEAEAEEKAAEAAEAAEAPQDEAPVSTREGQPADAPVGEPKPEESAGESAFGRREQPSAPAPERGRNGGALAAGAGAGGAAALLLAGGLYLGGLLPGGTPAPRDHAPAIAALETQLSELRTQVSALEAAGGEDAALAGRVADAEQRLAALTASVEALRDQLAGLDAGTGGEAAPVDLSPLEERIAAVEAAVAALDAAPAPQADLAAVDESIAALREEIAAAREGQAAAAVRLDALEETVARLGERVDEQAEAPATALIIAASSLKAAVDRGAPFTAELDTFAALAPDAPQVEGLRAYAASGVATRAQLAAESSVAADAMVTAARPVDPEAGIVDRLWASAMGLVQVRPIGMVEGDGVPEIVARLDAAVAAGDYQRAIVEYETLPETAKAAGAAFMARLSARHEADRLVDEALAAALGA